MIRRLPWFVGIVACVGVLALTVINVVHPSRAGVLALSEVFAPYLSLALVVFLPLAFAHTRDGRLLRILLGACLVVALVRFVPGTIHLPRAADPGALQVPVSTWNLELGQADPDAVVAAIRSMPAGIVALEELTHRHSDRISADPSIRARFPYQVLEPRGGSDGLGLLSSWPIADGWSVSFDPPIMSALVDPPGASQLAVVVGHPYRGVLVPGRFGLPTYVTHDRDAAITTLRGVVDPILAAGTPLVLLGDFNTVDREPAWADLSAGLIDAQASVGLGPGLTWRPEAIQWLPFGLLRIDAVFSANGLVPLDSAPDCTPRGSDHCILHATLELLTRSP